MRRYTTSFTYTYIEYMYAFFCSCVYMGACVSHPILISHVSFKWKHMREEKIGQARARAQLYVSLE